VKSCFFWMQGGGETTVTAPGKVLLTGGYLVLQRPLAGLVLALSSRFHTTVSSVEPMTGSTVTAVVESPQFDTVVTYRVELGPNDTATCEASNPYIAHALSWSLAYARHCGVALSNLRVRLVADNDFYSMLDELERRQLPLTAASLAVLPPHLRLGSSMSAMRKTGLGSSAALVTSLVAAICVHFRVASVSKPDELERLHQLSHFVHCLAQGKIGSGFDVSSACFGSQRYVRFSPKFLDPLLKEAESKHAVNFSSLFSSWDNEHVPLALPKGLALIMGDVSVGSNTPLMVSKVLKWKVRRTDSRFFSFVCHLFSGGKC
jgi:phosphomevalonate kinase